MDTGDQPFADLAAGVHAVVCAACAAKDQRLAALEAQRDELAAALDGIFHMFVEGDSVYTEEEGDALIKAAETALAKVPKKGG